jgi:hypothetical protein
LIARSIDGLIDRDEQHEHLIDEKDARIPGPIPIPLALALALALARPLSTSK